MLARAIAPAEGVAALDRLLAADGPRWVVSTQELAARIELGRRLTGEGFLEHLERGRPGAAAAPGAPGPPARRGRRVLGTPFAAAGTATEREIAAVWERVLGVERVGVDDNFFELGGNSLLGLQLVSELDRELGLALAPVDLFDAPSVGALARRVRPAAATAVGGAAAGAPVRPETDVLAERRRRLLRGPAETADRDVAIVGMAGRFPGARSVDELWANLAAGVESVTVFSDEELLAAGVPPELLADPAYVRAGAVLDGVDLFDAPLFGYSPREAEVMDPQHRIFLECAWEALERAGYDPSAYPGAIGVFAGSNLSTYLLRLHADPEVRGSVNMLQAILGNDRDSLTTAVSYKLGLRGPSVAVQTFCSTSLVATHMAVRSLRSGECDMALAGGIRVVVPVCQGYLYERGGLSPADGRSRPFDARADGSVLGNGVGLVVLKRLADALEDGDLVHAVIKGSAINNDGSLKAGYTAPSVEGQSEAVALAYEDAGVDPRTVGYLEAHGSATALGDPIEVAALTRAFRRWTGDAGFCALGSVKSNFGHLDRAAGVAGLIKAALALEREEIPPTLHFERPNPEIDFAASPFRVAAERTAWPRNGSQHGGNGSGAAPRRAGVSSLGMGGTNVHVVLEEAPVREPSGPSREHQLLVLSARSEAALERASEHLADHLEAAPETSLADAAFTLKVGRKTLEHRRFVVCRTATEAVATLRGEGPGRAFTGFREAGRREVAFLLPGIGAHQPGMARGLYETEPAFRDALDRCAALLEPRLGLDVRRLIYPAAEEDGEQRGEGAAAVAGNGGPDLRRMLGRDRAAAGPPAPSPLDRTRCSQPALFAVEYALAELGREWGVRPAALLGYSLGEYVAACLAGVLSLPDALTLVAERARLIDELPEGALLAVGLPEERLRPLLGDELSLMAVNGPEQTVASGSEAAIAALEATLAEEGAACRRLPATHPFHSARLEPAAGPLTEVARGLELRPPRIPYLSNVTGDWIRDEEAIDPAYWARHLVAPVRFSEGLAALAGGAEDRVLLEVGPGRTLTSLVLQHPEVSGPERAADAVASLGSPYESRSDQAAVLEALGRLWLLGVAPDWRGFHARERRRRTLLPTYPFERRRYWIETTAEAGRGAPGRARPAEPAEAGGAETAGGNGHGGRSAALGSYPRPGLRTEYAAPRSPTERRICELWQDLLGVERVGVHDSFLELGGDSLLATRLIARMRDAFELELPLRVFFERSTVAELARALEELRSEGGADGAAEAGGGDDELLTRIRGMSEEELDRELARLEGGAGGGE
ncbi:MAG TPA: beta-ketoacyl synthase N-terminal-like domain-containing protein [Thermoanaerobaculia bacterium]|nr:beta-ketoacyl synthase N-terminal-like domain-containing protein [Thermoanaerobaculia bacterium]